MKQGKTVIAAVIAGIAGIALAGCADMKLHDEKVGPEPGEHSVADRPAQAAGVDRYYYDTFELYGKREAAQTAEPAEHAETAAFELEDCVIYFDLDSAQIRHDETPGLDRCAQKLREHEALELVLKGHADDRGSLPYNDRLGAERAQSVRQALLARGLDAEQMKLESYGETQPVASGSGEGAWSRNRRVEIQARQ